MIFGSARYARRHCSGCGTGPLAATRPPFHKATMELAAKSLACRRAGRLVFSGVSFTIASGEAALLRGPNGSGKSSLLRLLAGLLPPEAGDAQFDGVSLRAERESFQQYLAYAGHLDAVKPQLTVAENLRLWARLYGAPLLLPEPQADTDEDDDAPPHRAGFMDEPDEAEAPERDRVLLALRRMGIARIADFPAGYCSAGQKRRLGLARLLVVDRPIWLLDEPTVSLDADAVETFAAIVREHAEEGGLVIAATHVPLGLAHTQEIVMGEDAGPAAAGPGWADEDDDTEGEPDLPEDPFLEGDWR